MIKFSHSIFALPFALAAVALASRGLPPPSPARLLAILSALVGARTAAMGVNRIVDLRFDRANPRTRGRELVTGAVSLRAAVALTTLAAAAFVAAAIALSPLCAVLAPLALLILIGYSYTKRFTWACHLVLGVALAGAPLGAWIAVRGGVSAPALLLGLGVATWVGGFDVLYSLSDLAFDRAAGLHSIPARFGVRGALAISGALHVATLGALLALGRVAQLGTAYGAGVGLIAVILAWEHVIVRPGDLSRLGAAFFTLNGYVSMAFLGFTLLDLALR
jgi:4-hydroxybenzoate polyprenyltransferase